MNEPVECVTYFESGNVGPPYYICDKCWKGFKGFIISSEQSVMEDWKDGKYPAYAPETGELIRKGLFN